MWVTYFCLLRPGRNFDPWWNQVLFEYFGTFPRSMLTMFQAWFGLGFSVYLGTTDVGLSQLKPCGTTEFSVISKSIYNLNIVLIEYPQLFLSYTRCFFFILHRSSSLVLGNWISWSWLQVTLGTWVPVARILQEVVRPATWLHVCFCLCPQNFASGKRTQLILMAEVCSLQCSRCFSEPKDVDTVHRWVMSLLQTWRIRRA